MPKKTTRSGSGAMKSTVLGASLAGLAATAYFFLGPKGKEHQKDAKAWAIKMKGDVLEKLETARDISEPVYHQIIDSVAAEHEKGLKSNPKEIRALAQDLKKHWKTISNSARVTKRQGPKEAEKVAKKGVALTKKSSKSLKD